MNKNDLRVGKQVGFFFLSYVILAVSIFFLPEKLSLAMVRENGPVESLTVYFYFVFCVFFVYFRLIKVSSVRIITCLIIFFLGLRELDYHEKFTTMGIFKSRYYISPEVPADEKTVVTIIVLTLIVILGRYIFVSFNHFKMQFKARESHAVLIACAIMAGIVSKIIDSNSELLTFIVIKGRSVEVSSRVFEECLELMIPLLFLFSLVEYCRSRVKVMNQQNSIG